MTAHPTSDERYAAAAEHRWITQPGDQQHTAGGNCPCRPERHPSGAWDHR